MAIDPRTSQFEYNLPDPVSEWFKATTELHPDLLFACLSSVPPHGTIHKALIRLCGQSIWGVPKIEHLVNSLDPATISSGDYAFLIALWRAESSREEVRSLSEKVVCQGAFLDHMHEQLWIWSPALEDTLRRAVDR